MCFEFSSCFGGGRDDYGGERSNRNRNEDGGRRRGRRGNNNRIGYYAGADHYQPPAAVDEAGHKAYHDGTRKAIDNVGAGGRHGGYAAYAHHKADIETPKLPGVPAWPNKVSDDAYKYTARLQEPSAMDYHHYPTTTTTTAIGRY